ncbi:MAG: hypothetical protein K2X77_08050 [Candidatus Obscuribacterales bacterium]|nr:hypothetical protein [Candidatus Obscuribacterales bacterium]
MLQVDEKKKVTKSIGDLGRRVTAADVATKTGLPVLVVSEALNQIASETGGHLAVSTTGDVVYSFAPGFSNTYLTRGVARFFERFLEELFKILYYMVKISFGIMLVLSLAIIIITIMILFFSQKSSGNRRSDDEEFRMNFNFFDYLIFRDLLYYFTYRSPHTVVYDYNRPTVRRQSKSNFLLNCFSFLFGDGDPNEGLDEKRWQVIAKVIKQHNNVVTSEQLAPYLGTDPKNEDAVLPVLVRFNGKPEVTEAGNIVYTFPSLASTAGGAHTDMAPPFLKEFPWKFTEVESGGLVPVYIIAAINFGGAWFLWFLLHASSAPNIALLYNALAIYGTLFLVIPLIRKLWLNGENKKIEKRNSQRAKYAEDLRSPSPELKKKIAESREYRMRDQRITQGTVVYTTEKESLEQEDDLERQFKDGTFDASP